MPDPSWSDDEFEQYLVRTLAETGRRATILNETARASVMQALLAENARLAKANLQASARHVAPAAASSSWLDRVIAFFGPRRAMPLGSALAVIMLAAGYFLYGGSREVSFGTIRGAAMVVEKRQGPFQLAWHFDRNLDGQDEYAVHSSDEIQAISAVTITLADGSVVTASPNTRFQVLVDAKGGQVIHEIGETAYHITPSSDGLPKFWVNSPEGKFTVKGTTFRVRSEKDSIVQYTDEGVVGASASGSSAGVDVRTGEQVRISKQKLGVPELQVPRIQFQSMTVDPMIPNLVFTNRDVITMSARVYPSSVLIAMDMTGAEVARFIADKRGVVNGALSILPGAKNEFQFYVRSSSDTRRSQLTDKVSIQLDKVAPKLGSFPPTLLGTGAEFEVKGRTEPGVQVFVNSTAVPVDANGEFDVRLPRPTNMTQVQIVARDQAGNTTQIVQKMDDK